MWSLDLFRTRVINKWVVLVLSPTPNIGLILITDNDSNAVRSHGDVLQGPERDSPKAYWTYGFEENKAFSLIVSY